MNCPNCQSTNHPIISDEMPPASYCPDCGEDTEDDPGTRTMSKTEHEALYEVAKIKDILADPHKVMLNMIHGTISWTPETLRRVLGPDPVRDILEAMVAELDGRPVPDVIEDLVARAKAALTATEPK